jgi:thiamine-phosphate pyrophosphorylase
MESMHLPPLYPITDARSPLALAAQIRRLGEAGFPLVQFRGKPLDAAAQWRELRTALAEAAERGGWPAICVNDRSDLALLAAREGLAPWGLHLGQTDLPPAEARALPGLGRLHLGGSTHCAGEWEALDPACDHAGIGPFRATATKPDHAGPVGLDGLRAGCAALRARGVAPVAIGGLTLADAPACFQAGAEALAMVGAVARAGDPGELLWRAQIERWRVRPPLVPGRGVVLLGGSGAGKSSLAACLGRLLGLPVQGSDQRVEARGRSIAAIFAASGEAGFRALEAQAVLEGLAAPCVLALGAGAWQDPATREAVRASGFCALWLAEVPLRAWARVGRDPARPLAAAREQFLARWAQRTPAWSQAPMVLPLGRSPQELAQALVQCLHPELACQRG